MALLGAALQRGRELMLLMQRQRVAPDFWASGGVPSEKAAKIMGKHRNSQGNQGFTGFTQENVDVKPEKNVGLARFHHSDGSFNHQHKEFEEEKNSDMSWVY